MERLQKDGTIPQTKPGCLLHICQLIRLVRQFRTVTHRKEIPTAGVRVEHPRTWPKTWDVRYDGNDSTVADFLYQHYRKNDSLPGVDARIDWSYFSNRSWFKGQAYKIRVGDYRQATREVRCHCRQSARIQCLLGGLLRVNHFTYDVR